MRRHKHFKRIAFRGQAAPAEALEAFGAEPVTPPTPPAPPLLELIAAARKADVLAHGKASIPRVAARLDRVALIEIVLRADEFGRAWRTAATRRLGERAEGEGAP